MGRVYDEFQVRVAVDAEALVGESDVTYHGMAEGFETSAFLGNFATFTKSAESWRTASSSRTDAVAATLGLRGGYLRRSEAR